MTATAAFAIMVGTVPDMGSMVTLNGEEGGGPIEDAAVRRPGSATRTRHRVDGKTFFKTPPDNDRAGADQIARNFIII